jgi:hypothetical protein
MREGPWGRRLRLRRVSRPANCCAGPAIFLRRASQPSFDRIVDNVVPDAPKFDSASHQMIVAFVLPKRQPRTAEHFVDLSCAVALQPTKKFRYVHMGSQKHMNVIRHNHPGMQITARLGAVLYATANQPGYFRSFQIDRSVPGSIQQSIHRNKRLSRTQAILRKFATNRQTAMQSKSDKQGLADAVDVRQTAA